ncbi:MAG: ParB N-terminal domain-containing protein [Polyangiaceae bacterium]|nr:ParB N-terminal domain-containing protein [Polyangiaceae bacterium]
MEPQRDDAPRRQAQLSAFVRKVGMVLPLVVRPHPEVEGRYQIIDGEHRWRDAVESRRHPRPLRRARCRRPHRPGPHGQPQRDEGQPRPRTSLAQLIHELHREASLEDLSTLMPYTERELADHLAILQVPAGLELELEQAVKEHKDNAPTALTFVVDEPKPVETAIAQLADTLEGKNRRGRALVLLATWWLRGQDGGAAGGPDGPVAGPEAQEGAPTPEPDPEAAQPPQRRRRSKSDDQPAATVH